MNVKKAVILARGLGSRMRAAAQADKTALSPEQAAAADAGAKGMIDVGRPFLDFVISALADAGITEVCLVIGPEHDIFRNYYGALATKRIRISFAVQEEPLGTANAVAAARAFAGDDRFIVVNSDNYYPAEALRQLAAAPGAAALGFNREALVAQSNIPAERVNAFAIMITQAADGHTAELLETIVEKPEPTVLTQHPHAPISMNAWLFTPAIFPAIDNIELSVRGEYEIVDAVRYTVQHGEAVTVIPVAAGVLDMSNRDDIAAVAGALADIEVSL